MAGLLACCNTHGLIWFPEGRSHASGEFCCDRIFNQSVAILTNKVCVVPHFLGKG